MLEGIEVQQALEAEFTELLEGAYKNALIDGNALTLVYVGMSANEQLEH